MLSSYRTFRANARLRSLRLENRAVRPKVALDTEAASPRFGSLSELLGGDVNAWMPEPSVPVAALRDKLEAFEGVFLGIKDAVEVAAGV